MSESLALAMEKLLWTRLTRRGAGVYALPQSKSVSDALASYEAEHRVRVLALSVCVLYLKAGQRHPKDVWRNRPEDTSPFYTAFLAHLGARVRMDATHTGFRGEVKNDGSDAHLQCYYTQYQVSHTPTPTLSQRTY